MCAPRKKLIIELDGTPSGRSIWSSRTMTRNGPTYLEARGYRVLRFWNNDVMKNMDAILQAIWHALQDGEKKK
jgi:very-short-patch-repair endonuclease